MRDGVRTQLHPDPETAQELVAGAFDRGVMATLFGRCTVEYEGRASSTLGPGDRLVVLKPDGTALVHTDEGHQPVNWQPPGSDHAVAVTDGALVVSSERTAPAETLSVRFEAIDHAVTYDATDAEELALTGTEADLRDRILDDPALLEPGFEPRATERDTPAGAVDLFGVDADGRRVAVELKRRRVGPDAVSQLNRYVDALRRELHAEAVVRGVLVAPSVTDRARRLLAERGLEFVALEPL
ncbi:MAG: endonuclease NucS [Salinirussus sp.]